MFLSKFLLRSFLLSSCASFTLEGTIEKEYINQEYPSDHWSMAPKVFSDDHVVGFSSYKGNEYFIFLDNRDSRGYRTFISLRNNSDPKSVMNREFTSTERIGLALTMQAVSQAFERIVPIAQSAILGNNSHSFNPETGVTQLGQIDEPCVLHGHVWGRGNIVKAYVENVALGGPTPGEIFELRIKPHEGAGNNQRKPWKKGEAKIVSQRISNELQQIVNEYEQLEFTLKS